MKLFHYSHNNEELTVHNGLCMADDPWVCHRYAQGAKTGAYYAVEVPDAIISTIKENFSYQDNDHSTDAAAGRKAYADAGHIVIRYNDVDPSGNEHDTYRVVVDGLALDLVKIQVDEDGYEVEA